MMDLIIRGGTIVDGRGGEPYRADIAIEGGVIRLVGKAPARSKQEIDASGLLVTPGWVDIHTHYDGQATWDERLQPSSIQGVTTAVMGNCGVGFAPVLPSHRDCLIRLMEGVEDIPEIALHEGLRWNWETFPQYLDALAAMPRDIDLGAQVPHSALRVYVLGERGVRREAATSEEIQTMAALVREALKAGALGFSSSRVLFHRSVDGELAPSVGAAKAELVGIASALRDADAGVLQIVADTYNNDAEFDILRDMARCSGRPLSFSFVDMEDRPDSWSRVEERLKESLNAGLNITAQVQGRSVGMLLSIQGSVHPFITRPAYIEIAKLPVGERLAVMRDPGFKRRLLSEQSLEGHPFVNLVGRSWHKLFELGDPPEYEPPPEDSIAARAEALGVDAQELVYDILTVGDGTNYLYFPMGNFRSGSYDPLLPHLRHPRTLPGLSDGGAHVGVICDASVVTYMLSHWCRDRTRGEKLSLPEVVKRQTRDTAAAVGLLDRGVVRAGYRADLNLIDFARLRLKPPKLVHDLPAGQRRLMQHADGYVATIVAGRITYREGVPTGALPGGLIRGGQPAPVRK